MRLSKKSVKPAMVAGYDISTHCLCDVSLILSKLYASQVEVGVGIWRPVQQYTSYFNSHFVAGNTTGKITIDVNTFSV